MVKEKVSIQETVNFLNELLKVDAVAITALFSLRTACNEKLAAHKTVQVGVLGKNYYQVGIVGILNGLFGSDKHGWGHISANCDNGIITSFEVLSNAQVVSFIENAKKEV